MPKTSILDNEKLSVVVYPFYFVNLQFMHKTNCMQSIEKISMWEVFSSIMSLKDFPACITSELNQINLIPLET